MKDIKIFENKEITIDLEKFMDTRLLLCANSGGGKSYAFRKLLEEIDNQVMILILDVEGEYKTLREKYDYLLIGGDGDVPLSLKSAHLLPKKLFELNVSTIIDISELKSGERIQYVKKFLMALMELPKKYWKPCLLGIEETHKLCGQQDRHDSGPAVIDVFTRGRKRGICGVAITQRIAKLHKDVVAECNNVFSGRMWLPNDIKTASQILGISGSEAMELLRNLDPGEYHCFGPAVSKNVQRGKISLVKTTHPKVGIDLKEKIVPPTQKVKNILQELNNLPLEEEKKKKELNDYKTEVNNLKKQIRVLESSKPKLEVDEKKLERAEQKGYQEGMRNYKRDVESSNKIINKYATIILRINEQLKNVPEISNPKEFLKSPLPSRHKGISNLTTEKPITTLPPKTVIREQIPPIVETQYDYEQKLSPAYTRLLKSCAMFYPGAIARTKLAILSDVPIKSSTFRNGISKLKNMGFIRKEGDRILVTEEGIEKAGDYEELPTDSESLIKMWKSKLSPAYQRLLEGTINNYPNTISREDLSYCSDVPIESSTFRNGISKLKTLGLIEVSGSEIKAQEDLFN